MSNPADPAGGVRVTHDVDRAAVGQQVIELRLIGEFVDPRQVDQKQPARIVGRGIEAIEVHRLAVGGWCARPRGRARHPPRRSTRIA